MNLTLSMFLLKKNNLFFYINVFYHFKYLHIGFKKKGYLYNNNNEEIFVQMNSK